MQGTLYSIMIFPLPHGVNGADLAVWMLLLKHLCSALCSLSVLCETVSAGMQGKHTCLRLCCLFLCVLSDPWRLRAVSQSRVKFFSPADRNTWKSQTAQKTNYSL